MGCSTKGELYRAINEFKDNECINTVNLICECQKHGWAKVAMANFKTAGLKGMSYLAASKNENSVIMLRKSLPAEELNFVCGHEIIHVKFHRGYHFKTFSCFEKIQANQNRFLEWQANEGSAEMIVPLYDFLPKIKKALPHLRTWSDYNSLKFVMANQFNVTKSVISIRLESLKYEIYQYLNGTPIDNLQILSRNQQEARGIRVKSYNDIENELLHKEFARHNIDITA